MTDLVEQLRAYGGDEMLHQSAADELERLTAVLKDIADMRYSNTSAADIARRALERKP
jgi:hypothetical protein